jgi:hypothetical protein
MLFAWADDPAVKDNIVNLNSPEIIGLFVRGFRGKTAFVFDQMNVLDDSAARQITERSSSNYRKRII